LPESKAVSELRERIREVITTWVTGDRCEAIINQALDAASGGSEEERELRALGYAVAQAQPADERDRVFQVLRERVSRFAAYKVGAGQADDIAHMAMETLIGKYPHITRLEDLMPLTTTIAMNHIRHLWRRKSGELQNTQVDEANHFDPCRDPEEQVILRNLIDRMCAVIGSNRFKDKCRKVLQLVYAGVPYEEIRETMGAKTMATLYTWVHRCHNELRSGLGDSFFAGRSL
jgi:RNA polymerase sigma factor (sigma-70 family)